MSRLVIALCLAACKPTDPAADVDAAPSPEPDDAVAVDAPLDAAPNHGTYETPFAADSPWNMRPIDPVLSASTIPTDQYVPSVDDGPYSTMFVRATAADPPRTVYPLNGSSINLVYGTAPSITLPHWPATAAPASGSDGHLDIYDETTGVIHSFWRAQPTSSGDIVASQYNWSRIDGRGWGDPGLFYQGARATGVPTAAGIIRASELTDGDTLYHHALAMSLTYSGLSASPTFVFPATAADSDAASTNHGDIPEGALVMLPSTFDTSTITGTQLRKIAETLKTYGARIVDRNVGTPYAIYVEITTSGFSLHSTYPDVTNGWSNTAAQELQTIRAALRPVSSVAGWLDRDGVQHADLERKLRMIAGRGVVKSSTLASCKYNIEADRIAVSANGAGKAVIEDSINTGITPRWTAGKTYVFSVEATDPGITAALVLVSASSPVKSATIGNGQTATVTAQADVFSGLARIEINVAAGVSGSLRVSAVEQ